MKLNNKNVDDKVKHNLSIYIPSLLFAIYYYILTKPNELFLTPNGIRHVDKWVLTLPTMHVSV